MTDKMLDLVENKVVERVSDPVIVPQPYAQPADFTAQYPTPLDVTELLDFCEEVTLVKFIPEVRNPLNQHTWREMTSLAFTSGTNAIAFADGECPSEYTHDGANTTVDIKDIGAKKSLSERDIMHSIAVATANWNGINTLIGGYGSSSGIPGGEDMASFAREAVRGAKEKEIRLMGSLVLNAEDRLLVNGNHSSRPLEFTGIENWATNYSCTFHTNDNAASGTFSAIAFDRWLAEACAKPTHVLGHPQAIQEMMAAYFQLGFQGSLVVNHNSGNRLTPGYNFASQVFTGVGTLTVVSDVNFTKTNIGSTTAFQASLWALRMTHNGEPLVYRAVQIPLTYKDLAPGCTAISFEIWKAEALIIKQCCAQGRYISQFSGRYSVTTCTKIG